MKVYLKHFQTLHISNATLVYPGNLQQTSTTSSQTCKGQGSNASGCLTALPFVSEEENETPSTASDNPRDPHGTNQHIFMLSQIKVKFKVISRSLMASKTSHISPIYDECQSQSAWEADLTLAYIGCGI